LAERGVWEERVVGVSFDGTGYGDDGSIWGGEIFVGSIKDGMDRVAHLRKASLPVGTRLRNTQCRLPPAFWRRLRLSPISPLPLQFSAALSEGS